MWGGFEKGYTIIEGLQNKDPVIILRDIHNDRINSNYNISFSIANRHNEPLILNSGRLQLESNETYFGAADYFLQGYGSPLCERVGGSQIDMFTTKINVCSLNRPNITYLEKRCGNSCCVPSDFIPRECNLVIVDKLVVLYDSGYFFAGRWLLDPHEQVDFNVIIKPINVNDETFIPTKQKGAVIFEFEDPNSLHDITKSQEIEVVLETPSRH